MNNSMMTMLRNPIRVVGAYVLLLALAVSTYAASNKLYRYTNDRGVIAVDDHVPSEFVKNGYEILSPDGRVLETVPRQLTGEEGTRKRAAEAEAKRLREWDKNLLLRYSSIDDIADAQNRALREIDVRISILRSNLSSAKAQVESEQEKAADIERKGQTVPSAITDNIAKLKHETAGIEAAIAERMRDKENTRASYQQDIDRFKTLQAVVEYRRSNTGDGGK
jgi:chromosome segregation ATPase